MEEIGEQNILLNLNKDSYGIKPKDFYEKITNNLQEVIENENTDIDEYFNTISENYSNWGVPFYISNISLIENKPLLLFRPKIKPLLEKYFPKDFVIAFTVKPNLNDDKSYKPCTINGFQKIINSEKRDWEYEIDLKIYNTKKRPDNRNTKYIDKAFIDNLPLISKKTKEDLELWHDYIAWKYKADISTAEYREITNCKSITDGYQLNIIDKIPNLKNINDYGIYLFTKEDIKIEILENNNKVLHRLIYIKDNISEYKNYFGYRWETNCYNCFELKDNNIQVKTDKLSKDIKYVVFIKKDKKFTNTKQYENIKSFQEQGGYAPFLSSYLFDITKANLPKKSNKELNYFNQDLTDEQKEAVKVMVNSPDIALILGPPGTGKTTVIAECIYQYVKDGKKVMLTSESNDAVDNALKELFEEPEIIPLRLTSSFRDDNSKFNKKEVLKTYHENLIKPSIKTLENINHQKKQKETLTNHLREVEKINKSFIEENDRLNIQNKNKKLFKNSLDKSINEKVNIEKQLEYRKNINNLNKKIKNKSNEFFGEIEKSMILYFKENIIDKIDDFKILYFQWADDKKDRMLSYYINDGLNKYFKNQIIFVQAEKDCKYLNNLDGDNIISNDLSNKIEVLKRDIEEAEDNEDKSKYDILNSELSKLKRKKGLDVEQYVDVLEYYIIDLDKNRLNTELKNIKEYIELNTKEKSLSNKIKKDGELKEELNNKDLKNQVNIINKQESSKVELKEVQKDLELQKKNMKISKKEYEKIYNTILNKIKILNICEYQEILDKLDINNIEDSFNQLKDKNKNEQWVNDFKADQNNIKAIIAKFETLNEKIESKENTKKIILSKNKDIVGKRKEITDINNKIGDNENTIDIVTKNIKTNNERHSLNLMRILFNEDDEKRNIKSLKKDNSNLHSKRLTIEISIDKLQSNIAQDNKSINTYQIKIDKEIEEIKKIKLIHNENILNDLNELNNEKKIKDIKKLHYAEEDFEVFLETQENIKIILLEQTNLQNCIKDILKYEKEENKLKEDKDINDKEIEQNKKTLIDEKLSKQDIEDSITTLSNDLYQYEEEIKTIHNKQSNYKLVDISKKDDIVKEIEQLNQNRKSWTKESRLEYLTDKIGQNSTKIDVLNNLEYFIDEFSSEQEKLNDLLSAFSDYLRIYLNDTKNKEFDENKLNDEKNRIIDTDNNIEKIENNLKNIDIQIDKLKDKIKNDSSLELNTNTNLEDLIKIMNEKLSRFMFDKNSDLIENLLSKWIDNTKNHKISTDEEKLYMEHINVVGITLGASENNLRGINLEYFDVVIIDEISKSTPPEYLRGMMRSKKSILVGDHRQLPPMFGYQGQDLAFEELMHEEEDNTVLNLENYNKYKRMITASQFKEYFENANDKIKYKLTKQFRMHTDIMDIINCFYGGKLTQGLSKDKKEHNKHKQHGLEIGNFIDDKNKHAFWVDTSSLFNGDKNNQTQDGTSKYNLFEAFLTIEALKQIDKELFNMHNNTKEKQSLGIISFYKGQVKLLKKMATDIELKYFDTTNIDTIGNENFMISTVDSFQGRDRDIILVDLISTKSRVSRDNFVSSYQRINVAFSRAKNLLVIFGSKDIFDGYSVDIPDANDESKIIIKQVYKDIAKIIKKKGCGKSPSDISQEEKWKICKKRYGNKNDKK